MFGRLKQMLIKEFIQVFRDKRTRFLLFGPPVIQMLVFGYAATYDIRHVPTIVLDLDQSQESRELISRFTSSPYFDVQRQLTDSRQLRDLIDRGEATVGLEIDAGFAQKLRKGETAPLQVIVDATNSNTALIASTYISQIVLGFARAYQQDRIYRIAPQLVNAIPSIELEERPWYNSSLSSRWFFVPGVIGSLTLVLVITLTAFAVVREREIGTLEQIMVTPIRPAEFILGKTLPFFLIGLFSRNTLVPDSISRPHCGFTHRIYPVSSLHAWRGIIDLDCLVHATAGHGNFFLFHHAVSQLFGIRIPDKHHAAVDAIS
jgi:ABC-2 type transport system permease protein